MMTMRNVSVLDVKKLASYELSGLFAKIGAPHADNDRSSSPEDFNKYVFRAKHSA